METNIVAHGNTLVAAYHMGRLTGGGVTNIGWATSNDGGASWQHGAIPGTTVYAGGTGTLVTDPVVAYDAKHSAWMISYILEGSTNAAVASLSRDDGRTFGPPVTIATGDEPDKNWTACDNFASSPRYGTCYTEYDENGSGLVYMSRSTDGGQTWEAKKTTADSLTGIGGVPVVLPSGRVVVPISDSAFSRLSAFYSDDGGATWSASTRIADITTATPRSSLRAEPNPSATVDANGKIYLTWFDCQFESGCAFNDVVMSTSTDGVSWTAPARVGVFKPADSLDLLFPGIGTDGSRLGLTFYAVNAAGLIDAYYSTSSDGGATWAAPTHLAGPMQPSWVSTTARGRMLGDYTGTAFLGGVAFPAFSVALEPTTQQYRQGVYTFPQR
jgi:hypothetical protein